jgi:hypothetical protein
MHPIPEVTDIDIAFPTTALDILPKYQDIPKEFSYTSQNNKWVNTVRDWFFKGLKNAKWTPKKGVDQQKALRAIKVCLGDFSPSHEHKISGTAWLMAQWFDDVSYAK